MLHKCFIDLGAFKDSPIIIDRDSFKRILDTTSVALIYLIFILKYLAIIYKL